jgi:3-oxoacyl-[acyl-carrier-protein] synthase II
VKRTVVTGMGVASPAGSGTDNFFNNLLNCVSGIRPIAAPLGDRLKLRLGAQVSDCIENSFGVRSASVDRFSALALSAVQEAWCQSGAANQCPPEQTGVYFGTGFGGAATVETGYTDLFVKNTNRMHPLSVLSAMPNAAAANIALALGCKGPCLTYAVACASGAVAIGEASRAIQSGAVTMAVAGGTEAPLSLVILKAWEGLMALALEDRERPETSCRPFAKDRTGLVLGEGAGALVLEEYEHARARGAPILAEIAGYGLSNDATHLSKPDAEGQAAAMRAALREAALTGIGANDIAYLNAHGTATKAGDQTETESIKRAFGEHARTLPVSSTKALHGHLLGAAGAVEFIAALLALTRSVAPPTAHLWQADPACDLDYIPLEPRELKSPAAVMSNSFAFGGCNAVLIAKSVAPSSALRAT